MEELNKLEDQELEKVAGGIITEDEALARALKRARLKPDQIDFHKIELDYEHGRKVYEIEFYKGGFEFSVDIDAENGTVLKYKKEWDDAHPILIVDKTD